MSWQKFVLVGLAWAAVVCKLAACGGDGGEVVLHHYVADSRSFEANAYWLESEEGLVLIDALFLRPDAQRLAAQMKAAGKPLAGIILTHPHVDHFGGARWILDAFGEVPVIATRATAAGIPRTHADAYAAGWIQAYGDDYAAEVALPDRVVEPGEEIELAGLHFTLADFGAMEAENNSVVFNRELQSVFVGDAVLAGYIYYVGEGHSRRAVEQLPAIVAAFPEAQHAYSGHGGEASLKAAADENIAQVCFMRDTLRQLAADGSNLNPSGSLTPAARQAARTTMIERFRGYRSYGIALADFFPAYILPGLEAELRAEGADAPAVCP